MKFTKVFGLSLAHPYYPDGVCPDFAIEPTPRTGRLLANYRCVLKSGPGWVRVFNDATLLSPDKGDDFIFGLRLENPDFALFTDLSDYAVTLAPVYTNAKPALPGQLTLTSRPEWQQERFAWESAGGEGRFKLGGRPLAGAAKGLKVDGTGAAATADYDDAENAVAIKGASAKAGDPVTIGYYAQPVPRRGDFADVEILVGIDRGDVQQHGLGDFQIDFRPKRAAWAYYLVTDLKDPASDFKIVEDPADPGQPLGFAKSAPHDLDAQPDPGDAVSGWLAALHPGARRIRFVSDDPVPCRQSARRNVQLLVGANRLAAPLPNPAPGQFTTVADPTGVAASRRDAWYQIVRHLTR
jgi:hypothetical protein